MPLKHAQRGAAVEVPQAQGGDHVLSQQTTSVGTLRQWPDMAMTAPLRLHDILSSKDDQTIDATGSMLGGYASGLLKEARFSDMDIREPYWALFMAWDSRIRRRLKLRDLDTFLAVAQSGSMAKAAA